MKMICLLFNLITVAALESSIERGREQQSKKSLRALQLKTIIAYCFMRKAKTS